MHGFASADNCKALYLRVYNVDKCDHVCDTCFSIGARWRSCCRKPNAEQLLRACIGPGAPGGIDTAGRDLV
eukprot:2047780-Amphidinium_carterae.2